MVKSIHEFNAEGLINLKAVKSSKLFASAKKTKAKEPYSLFIHSINKQGLILDDYLIFKPPKTTPNKGQITEQLPIPNVEAKALLNHCQYRLQRLRITKSLPIPTEETKS